MPCAIKLQLKKLTHKTFFLPPFLFSLKFYNIKYSAVH